MERPAEEEVHLLFKKYGKPVTREFRFDLSERDEKQDYPECKGGAKIAVKNGKGMVMVRHPGEKRYGLPGGRIWADESVEEGAIREAKEETGLEVELRELPEMHKCQYLFRDWSLERWIFVFIAETTGGGLCPVDVDEIGEAIVFERLPSYYGEDHWLRGIWNEHFKP